MVLERHERFRSGVAARLAGVPVNTLRIWERRYAVVGPRVSAGRQRLYTAADIRRLSLIKQLVDTGHPIGAIASLDTEALFDLRTTAGLIRNARPGTADALEPTRGIRVALVSALLNAERIRCALAQGPLRIVGSCGDIKSAAAVLGGIDADIVIVELATLREADLDVVASIKAATRAASAIVFYRFAPGAVVRSMRSAGHAVARATSDATEIEAVCLSVAHRSLLGASGSLHSQGSAEPRPPRFDERTLAELSNASRTVECDCPKHLAELVLSLGGFERYSAECASRNPADVVLHLELQRAAGHARTIIEQALERVAIAEGIEWSIAKA